MQGQTHPRESWTYERGPRLDSRSTARIRTGLLVALAFCLTVWILLAFGGWLYFLS